MGIENSIKQAESNLVMANMFYQRSKESRGDKSLSYAITAKNIQEAVWETLVFVAEEEGLQFDSNRRHLSEEELKVVIRSEIMGYYTNSFRFSK